MDFEDTKEEAEFRAEARKWLDANAPTHLKDALETMGFGSSGSALAQFDFMAESKAWQKKKQEAGWACLNWPKEYGGRGATPIERVIWGQEEGVYSKLSGVFIIGQGMIGPTIMTYAPEEQKQRFLPRLASGEEIWCQLFSEPAAGSDLAGIRTRAVKEGDEWVINGQKIWTSGAHYSDYGMIVTRTDPSQPKHKGLTMFWLAMDAPGVEVRPIKQVNGGSAFNEVYFTDVRIPDEQRLGEVNDGWNVSLTTLMNERLAIGGSMPTGFQELFEYLQRAELDEGPAIKDAAVRERIADWHCKTSGLKYASYRSISALSRGERPGPESSIGKLVAGSMMQDIATFALDIQEMAGVITDPAFASAAARFQQMALRSPATRIEGGTDEILRNIIAERVLGLPADVRLDKDKPFSEIPSGTQGK